MTRTSYPVEVTRSALRPLLLGCLLLGLGPAGCSQKDGGASGGDAGKASELLLGKWQHRGDNNTEIDLEFAGGRVSGKWKAGGSGPSMSGSYEVGADSTIEMPKFGGPGEEKVRIDSIAKDKLVLSGFSYKPGSYAFTRPGAAAAPGGAPKGDAATTQNQDRVLWIHAGGQFEKSAGNLWIEHVGDTTWHLIETKRTPEYVELYAKDRDVRARLEAGRSLNKEGNGPFEALYEGTWAQPAPGSNRLKIVGTWDAAKTKEFPLDIRLDFARDGGLKMTVKAAKPVTRDLAYSVYRDKITTVRSEGGKDERDTWTIRELNDSRLVYVDGRGTVMTFTRKK